MATHTVSCEFGLVCVGRLEKWLEKSTGDEAKRKRLQKVCDSASHWHRIRRGERNCGVLCK